MSSGENFGCPGEEAVRRQQRFPLVLLLVTVIMEHSSPSVTTWNVPVTGVRCSQFLFNLQLPGEVGTMTNKKTEAMGSSGTCPKSPKQIVSKKAGI